MNKQIKEEDYQRRGKWNHTRVYGLPFAIHCLFSSLVIQFRNLFFPSFEEKSVFSHQSKNENEKGNRDDVFADDQSLKFQNNRMKVWKNGFSIQIEDQTMIEIVIDNNVKKSEKIDKGNRGQKENDWLINLPSLRAYLLIFITSTYQEKGKCMTSLIHFEIQKLISILYNFQVWDEVKNNCFIHLADNHWLSRSRCLLLLIQSNPSPSSPLNQTPSTRHLSFVHTNINNNNININDRNYNNNDDDENNINKNENRNNEKKSEEEERIIKVKIGEKEYNLADLLCEYFVLPTKISSPSLPLYEREVYKLSIIGEGFSGIVWKAFWRVSNEFVAVKEINLKIPNSEVAILRIDDFYKEVYFLSDLHHKNIVKFKGFYSQPQCYIMEYIAGGTLQDLFKNQSLRSKLTWKLITRIALEIASAILYLHRRSPPLVHSDLQLKNILIVDLNENAPTIVKIADFGSSTFTDWTIDLYGYRQIIRQLVDLYSLTPNQQHVSSDQQNALHQIISISEKNSLDWNFNVIIDLLNHSLLSFKNAIHPPYRYPHDYNNNE